MPGTHHHRQEQLRRAAEQQLADRMLPPWQKRVLQRLSVEVANGWYPLLNQFAPHTPAQRPDVVLAGPQGVLVIMLRENEPDWGDSGKAFVWVSELLAGATIGPAMVSEAVVRAVVIHPTGHTGRLGDDEERTAITEDQLDAVLFSGERLLSPDEARSIAEHLDGRTFDLAPLMWSARRIPLPRGAGAATAELFDPHEQRLRSALQRPFRDWRIFLDGTQLGAVRRSYSGPARITGPAGTGKSVIALHRLAYLARRTTGKLLFTSHLSTVPSVAAEQFRQLAPHLGNRVEFVHLHAWARDFLAGRGRLAEVDDRAVEAAFESVWQRAELSAPLRGFRNSRGYWKDEIDRVIKGRAIRSFEAYRAVPRKGRGRPLPPDFRSHVWQFYCEYERELSESGVFDHNDVLMRALAELERRPLPRQYAAVVVDEVQDLTLSGLRLAHEISGDDPDQLLLVGDGQQQVYAGGWRLSEAGIELKGRGEILRHNYRNRSAVLDRAGQLEAINRFDDLDGGPSVPLDAALPQLPGGRVVEWHGSDQEDALLEALRGLDDDSATAVLTSTNASAERWEKVLRSAGVPARPLDRWDGRTTGPVLVGTLFRAKGTEFRNVFLPGEPDSASTFREDREAQLRRRLVAMTRARDYLWIGVPHG